MALCLKRGGALAGRALLSYLRSAATRHCAPISPFSTMAAAANARRSHLFNSLENLYFVNSRGFAKGKKSKDVAEDNTVQVAPDIGPMVKSTATSQMEVSMESLSRELSKLRTGRASAGMLDHIIVKTGNAKLALSRLAVVSVLDPHTLAVTPYDPETLKLVQTAISQSPLGINPTPDGHRLIVAIPPLTKEGIQAMCKVISKSAEDVKQSIRRARQKAFETIKKSASGMPKDDVKRLEKEVDDITKRFVKSADDMCKTKEKEISGS